MIDRVKNIIARPPHLSFLNLENIQRREILDELEKNKLQERIMRDYQKSDAITYCSLFYQ